MTNTRKFLDSIVRRAMSSASSTRTSSPSSAATTKLKKIDARVFCLGNEGGNPVTIFASPDILPGSLQERLAKSCDWESVLVSTSHASPSIAFYMPSGEQVSFCAHAAIGGAIAMGDKGSSWTFRAAMTGDKFTVEKLVNKNDEIASSFDKNGRNGSFCRLHINGIVFDEAPLSEAGKMALEEWSHRLDWSSKSASLPPRNASVARPKTLVELESVDAVQRARVPTGDGSFADACATMDDSTGVYLYAQHENRATSYECRQFPRSSGYPEDPATGIAAAALAASLRFGPSSSKDESTSIDYDIYQGTAMGRPSLIQVVDLRRDEHGSDRISFGLQGRVGIDATSTIEVSE